jgi:hypothetical protein
MRVNHHGLKLRVEEGERHKTRVFDSWTVHNGQVAVGYIQRDGRGVHRNPFHAYRYRTGMPAQLVATVYPKASCRRQISIEKSLPLLGAGYRDYPLLVGDLRRAAIVTTMSPQEASDAFVPNDKEGQSWAS